MEPDLVTDLFPNEERKHPKLRDSAEKGQLGSMLSVAGEGVTYEYDETAKAGIENVWCGHLKLDMMRQSAVCRHRPEGTHDGQGRNA